MTFAGWNTVARHLRDLASFEATNLDDGQKDSLYALAHRCEKGGRAMLIADEVGMGKTRIAAALIEAVRRANGRSAVVLPAGLGVQWQAELREMNQDDRTLLPVRSFEGFLGAWLREEDISAGWASTEKKRKRALSARRNQRELPDGSWADEPVVMLSHTLAAFQFQQGNSGPRRTFLPAVRNLLYDPEAPIPAQQNNLTAAWRAAADVALTDRIEPLRLKDDNPADLTSDEYRKAVLPLIGRGLGRFDLVVIDEAHKARGTDSSLSRILGPMIWRSDDSFSLGMTATPVELGADQWRNTLERLMPGVLQEEGFKQAIDDYVNAVRRLDREPISEDLVRDFEIRAATFEKQLSCYVLRRDKRGDPVLAEFTKAHGSYRRIHRERISASNLPGDWLRFFCAAEAASLLPSSPDMPRRLRLTVEKGYGAEGLIAKETEDGPERDTFWTRALKPPAGAETYGHPALQRAIKIIEQHTVDLNRKVLVFGTFTTPIRKLVQILDARALLRHLREKPEAPWPAQKVPEPLKDAVKFALALPEFSDVPYADVEEIDDALKRSYESLHTRRNRALRELHTQVGTRKDDTAQLVMRVWPQVEDRAVTSRMPELLRALDERDGFDSATLGEGRKPDADAFLAAVDELIDHLLSDDAEPDPEKRLETLSRHLDGFSGRDGSYARLLVGATAPQTRRYLQDAFNREGAWPMVLVAQSQVGREGLNLHRDCRTVVLLHAEWNPGVVEQQIGRVDRKESRFLKDYNAFDPASGSEPPRIDVYAIQVDGGYDSLQWSILQRRWDDLRAQLHGNVLSDARKKELEATTEYRLLLEKIFDATPDFHPPKRPAA